MQSLFGVQCRDKCVGRQESSGDKLVMVRRFSFGDWEKQEAGIITFM
jgi:hypothetical protein